MGTPAQSTKNPARHKASCLKANVLVHMTPSEREQVEAIASQEMRSLSATTRMLLLTGIQQYQKDTETRGA